MYGFAKSARANIGAAELKALKLLAKSLLAYTRVELETAVQAGELFEVSDE